jgi:hypothetical protein
MAIDTQFEGEESSFVEFRRKDFLAARAEL